MKRRGKKKFQISRFITSLLSWQAGSSRFPRGSDASFGSSEGLRGWASCEMAEEMYKNVNYLNFKKNKNF